MTDEGTINSILIAIAIVLLLAAVLTIVIFNPGEGSRRLKRIARMKQRSSGKPRSVIQDAVSLRKAGRNVSPVVAVILRYLPNISVLSNKLQRAGYSIDGRQYMLRCLLGFFVLTFAVWEYGRPLWVAGLVGFVLAILLPLKMLSRRIEKSKKRFLTLFPDGIDLIVRGLRSGLPVADSIGLVASEVPDPVKSVFGHVSNTIKLGVTLEKALQEIAKKLDYTEFNFFVTSIILQRETGGNLSEILDNLADVLRKRIMLQLKVKAMTSEARVSSVIVGLLPFLVMGAVSFMSPGYLNVLYDDPRGQKWAIAAGVLLVGGMWVMRRLGKFEI